MEPSDALCYVVVRISEVQSDVNNHYRVEEVCYKILKSFEIFQIKPNCYSMFALESAHSFCNSQTAVSRFSLVVVPFG